MKSLLIGHSGFLGKSFSSKIDFDDFANSKSSLSQQTYDFVICAAPSAKKWLAYQNPEEDLAQIKSLMQRISLLRIGKLILLSTVDVYEDVSDSVESSKLCDKSNPYGFHRQILENHCMEQVENLSILRLGGLVGPGLVKNPVFDLKHLNNLHLLNTQSKMQFLPVDLLVNYCLDILRNDTKGTLNLTAEPVFLSDVSKLAGAEIPESQNSKKSNYDVASEYLTNEAGTPYFVDRDTSMSAINRYFKDVV